MGVCRQSLFVAVMKCETDLSAARADIPPCCQSFIFRPSYSVKALSSTPNLARTPARPPAHRQKTPATTDASGREPLLISAVREKGHGGDGRSSGSEPTEAEGAS